MWSQNQLGKYGSDIEDEEEEIWVWEKDVERVGNFGKMKIIQIFEGENKIDFPWKTYSLFLLLIGIWDIRKNHIQMVYCKIFALLLEPKKPTKTFCTT